MKKYLLLLLPVLVLSGCMTSYAVYEAGDDVPEENIPVITSNYENVILVFPPGSERIHSLDCLEELKARVGITNQQYCRIVEIYQGSTMDGRNGTLVDCDCWY